MDWEKQNLWEMFCEAKKTKPKLSFNDFLEAHGITFDNKKISVNLDSWKGYDASLFLWGVLQSHITTDKDADWITENGELQRKQVNIFIGKAGTFKTTLMIDSLNKGLFFGQYKVHHPKKKLTAMFVQGDYNQKEFNEEISACRVVDPYINIKGYFPQEVYIQKRNKEFRWLSKKAGWEAFYKVYAEIKPDILIIDNLSSVLGDFGFAGSAQDFILEKLTFLCTNSCNIILHHPSKTGRSGGSVAWENLCNNIIYSELVSDKNPKVAILTPNGIKKTYPRKIRAQISRTWKDVAVNSLLLPSVDQYEITYQIDPLSKPVAPKTAKGSVSKAQGNVSKRELQKTNIAEKIAMSYKAYKDGLTGHKASEMLGIPYSTYRLYVKLAKEAEAKDTHAPPKPVQQKKSSKIADTLDSEGIASSVGMYRDVKTWNPFVGCLFDCVYCEKSFKNPVKRFGKKSGCTDCVDYKPHEHDERLSLKQINALPKTKTIWPCGTGDIAFAKPAYIRKIIKLFRESNRSENEIYWQTKDPKCLEQYLDDFKTLKNSVIVTTLETNRNTGYRQISKAPLPSKRYEAFKALKFPRKVVTIEPILDFDPPIFLKWLLAINPVYVWIGYDSKNYDLPAPTQQKFNEFIEAMKKAGLTVKGKKIKA